MASNDAGEPTLAWAKTSSNEMDASLLQDGLSTDDQLSEEQSEDAHKPHLKPLPSGTMIDGRYEVISVLGRGGCGCVYKVRQMVMGKVLALKTLNPSTSRVTIMRLQKEAQALSRLEHPNIVQAFDFGMLGEDQPFFVMENVSGPTLAQYFKRQGGRISLEAMVDIFVPLCQALSYANERGVVHRDIKPSNIILAEDVNDPGKFVPKLVDFGIAKIQFGDEGAKTLTRTGEIFGTPLYMSPEQCLGSKVDHRSDIYSLGCVMFQALTGSPPFSGSSPIKTMMEHSSAAIPSLTEMCPDAEFPLELEQIIARMLAKSPADRYQNFKQVQEALLSVRYGKEEKLAATLQRVERGRKQAIIFASVATLVLLVVAFSFSTALFKTHDVSKSAKRSNSKQAETDPVVQTINSFTTIEKEYFADSPNYFSSTEGNGLVFKFPKKTILGKLKFWTSDTEKREEIARRSVSVPGNAKLTLFAAGPLLTNPTLWNKFRPTDLYGVRIDFADAMSAEKLDDAVDAVLGISAEQHAKKGGVDGVLDQMKKEIDPNTLQDANLKAQNLSAVMSFDNLHLLALLFGDFNERTWLHMGTMPKLRWVWLDGCKLDGKMPRGENLVELSNLTNLRVLSIDRFEAPSAMLTKLGRSTELKRLSLGVVPISKQDVSLIAKIPNLDTLRLRELTLGNGALEQLAEAPHLERLALDEVSIKQTSMLSGLVKLRHLKELVVDFPKDSKEFQAIKVVPGCEVHTRHRAHTDWFDWTKENPDVTGLW
jgi:Serine/threonine protein kinase